ACRSLSTPPSRVSISHARIACSPTLGLPRAPATRGLQVPWGRGKAVFAEELMADHEVERGSTAEGVRVSPAMAPGLVAADVPILATGGAMGSLVGQLLHTTAAERKTLLSAGAAAGMAATFGAPVSAVLLAVELLLFEFRPRSLVPVALASATAAGVRILFDG